MERIQQAIEKARLARQQASAASGNNSNHANTREAAILTADFSQARNGGHKNIEYSATQKLEISNDTLIKNRIIGGMAHDERSDNYRVLRSQVLQKMRANNWQTLAITSPARGNGSTNIAVNLAVALSQEVNQTVLLADMDLRNPAVAQMFGIDQVEAGLMDYLNQSAELDQVLFNPGYPRLVVLPGTPQGPHSSEILSSPAMLQLQNELKSRYQDRVIIYDLPPLLASDDALVFLPNVDAILLVIEDGGCKKAEIERAVKLLKPFPLLGTVLNKLKN